MLCCVTCVDNLKNITGKSQFLHQVLGSAGLGEIWYHLCAWLDIYSYNGPQKFNSNNSA